MADNRKVKQKFTQIIVSRHDYKFARHFSDIEFYDDGIGYFFMYRTQQFRLPIWNTIVDSWKRFKRRRMSLDEAVKYDPALEKEIKKIRKMKPSFVKFTPEHRPRNGFFKWEDVEGVMIDQKHKEFEFNIKGGDYVKFIVRMRKTFEKVEELITSALPNGKVKIKEEYIPEKPFIPVYS